MVKIPKIDVLSIEEKKKASLMVSDLLKIYKKNGDLASAIGVSGTSVSVFKSGKVNPSRATFERIKKLWEANKFTTDFFLKVSLKSNAHCDGCPMLDEYDSYCQAKAATEKNVLDSTLHDYDKNTCQTVRPAWCPLIPVEGQK